LESHKNLHNDLHMDLSQMEEFGLSEAQLMHDPEHTHGWRLNYNYSTPSAQLSLGKNRLLALFNILQRKKTQTQTDCIDKDKDKDK